MICSRFGATGVLYRRSKPYGDPSMGVRWPWAEHGGAQGPPGPCTAKPMSRALTLLGERATYQSRAQRAADLILGQTPSVRVMVSPRTPANMPPLPYRGRGRCHD